VHLSIFAQVMGIVLIWKWLFVTTVISQGSVATRLRCGGQCDSQFVANFLANSTMEKFRKSVNICQSYGQKYRGPFFDSQCILTTSRTLFWFFGVFLCVWYYAYLRTVLSLDQCLLNLVGACCCLQTDSELRRHLVTVRCCLTYHRLMTSFLISCCCCCCCCCSAD